MKKFKIDYSFIITALLIIFSPAQKKLLPLFIVLCIHELGHLIICFIFRIKIRELRLSAFGFFLDTDTTNLKIHQELLLYIGGILFNLISLSFFKNDYKSITIGLIIFNLLPIYPLDGYRILRSLLSYIFKFKISLLISNIISIITITSVFIYSLLNLDYLGIFNLMYLLILSILEIKSISYIYQTFMLFRYLYKPNLKERRINFSENMENKLYKYHNIYTKIDTKKITESEILDLYYK